MSSPQPHHESHENSKPGRVDTPAAALVRLAAFLVPGAERERWKNEWLAELAWAWKNPRRELPTAAHRLAHWIGLCLTALGTLPDALEMQRTFGERRMPLHITHDIRFAWRSLSRRRGYAALLALTLALGIGAATAVFTVVDNVLLRPLPFHEPENLVTIESLREGGFSTPYMEPAVLEMWQAQRGLFENVARYRDLSVVLEELGEPRDLRAVHVSSEFFTLLGVVPERGRAVQPDDILADARVVVLSDPLWRSALGADPEAIGRSITFSGERYTVVGVMPQEFRYPLGTVSAWFPMPHVAAEADTSAAAPGPVSAFARLASGVSPELAQQRVDALAPQLAEEVPGMHVPVRVQPMGSWRANSDIRRALLVLSGAVGFVLLIACANAANLLLVRATSARHDLGVRLALGATRVRVVRELMAEAGLVALAGGALGVLLSWWGVKAIMALAPAELVRWSYGVVAIDLRILVFALALTFGTMLLFGIMPALQATATPGGRRAPRRTLAFGERSGTGSREQRKMRNGLVVAQLALSVMLMVGAGLLTSSFVKLWNVDPGMQVHNLALLQISPSSDRYATRTARAAFYDQVLERIEAMPGVQAVSVVSGTAGGAGGLHISPSLEVEGSATPVAWNPEIIPMGRAGTGYFRTLGIPILQGREFTDDDMLPDANTAIIDVDLARHLFPEGNAVGRRFRVSTQSDWRTVVGVAGDVKLFGPDDREQPFEVYYPAPPGALGYAWIAARTSGEAELLLPLMKAAVHEADPLQPVGTLQTAEQQYREPLARPRFLLTLMAVFAATATLLAAVGLYGTISYAVAQRTRELGVRMALGARAEQIVRSVVGEGARLAAFGVVLGLVGSAALGGYLSSLLFGVAPADPVTFATVAALLGTIAVLAALAPAVRASRIDPVIAMRAE